MCEWKTNSDMDLVRCLIYTVVINRTWLSSLVICFTCISRYQTIKLFFFKDFIYSWVTQRERGRDTGRGRSRLPAGNPMLDLIPQPWDHDLSQRQMLNHWATQVPVCKSDSIQCQGSTFPESQWSRLNERGTWESHCCLFAPHKKRSSILSFKQSILIIFREDS